jgi:hypothetical protein
MYYAFRAGAKGPYKKRGSEAELRLLAQRTADDEGCVVYIKDEDGKTVDTVRPKPESDHSK